MAQDLKKAIHPKIYMYRRIVEAKLFIDSHFHERIDLENISNQAHFSKYHFLRLFKSAFGKTPHKYLTDVRLTHARSYLLQNRSVKNTCYAVGFESIPSFITLFKKRYGFSPSEFLKRADQLQNQKEQAPFRFIPNCFAESYGWTE